MRENSFYVDTVRRSVRCLFLFLVCLSWWVYTEFFFGCVSRSVDNFWWRKVHLLISYYCLLGFSYSCTKISPLLVLQLPW
jgi:hypothetical protein